MTVNLIIEGIIQDCVFRAKNNDIWNNYKINIITNIKEIDFQNKIENYKPSCRYLYVSRPIMIDILYKIYLKNGFVMGFVMVFMLENNIILLEMIFLGWLKSVW